MNRIELSERMKMNFRLVPQGCSLADVGCDHGYVSIALAQEKRCRNIIAVDVREGPLTMARRNIERAQLQGEIQCRLSDGLAALSPKEADTVLLAGMGGMLICRILREQPDVMRGISTLVIQAQSDWYTVRKTLWELGFCVDAEDVCLDMGKYYFAIRAVRGVEEVPYTEEECTYGRLLCENKNEVYHAWLQKERKMKENIWQQLQAQDSRDAKKRGEELQRELAYIQRLERQYYGG